MVLTRFVSRLAIACACASVAAAQAQPGDNTLNLRDADIRVFIETVSEITGRKKMRLTKRFRFADLLVDCAQD